MDKRGVKMWETIWELIASLETATNPQDDTK
jgi:hypothetical protein